MVLKTIARKIIGFFHKIEEWSQTESAVIYDTRETAGPDSIEEIHSVWDYLNFRPNTQAYHLASTLGFEEWVDMGEIRRRVKELFGVEYKNERSLYPYLKTLTDIGLMENSSAGGRMHWRKQDLSIKIGEKEYKKIISAQAIAKKEGKKTENQE